MPYAEAFILWIDDLNHDRAGSRGWNGARDPTGTPRGLLLTLVIDSCTVFVQHSVGGVAGKRPIIDCLPTGRLGKE